MNKTQQNATLLSILAGGALLTGCAKDNNKSDYNPLSPDIGDTDETPSSGSKWNYDTIDKTLSESLSDVDVDISVLGDYNASNTVVKVNDIETSNYGIEVIDQMYKITLNMPVGVFNVKISDNDDSSYEQRKITVKAKDTADVFNTKDDFLDVKKYKNDAYATNSYRVGASKAEDMFTKASGSLSSDAQTIIDRILDNSDVNLGKDNIEKVVIGNEYLSVEDKQGRYHVLDMQKTDVDIIRNQY